MLLLELIIFKAKEVIFIGQEVFFIRFTQERGVYYKCGLYQSLFAGVHLIQFAVIIRVNLCVE